MPLILLALMYCLLGGTPAPHDCATAPMELRHQYRGGTDVTRHWERTVTLPATGRFVQEGHYVTTADSFPDGRLFANTVTENIDAHLVRALAVYQRFDSTMTLAQLYTNTYERRWTPAERGLIGQGAVGDIQTQELTPDMEPWLMNMMWAPGTRPARGTKFLLSANGRQVVVIAGYETGPSGQQFLGGVTCEVHRWLGTDADSEILIGYLVDQGVVVGPMECGL